MILQKIVNLKGLKKQKSATFNFLIAVLFVFVVCAMIIQPEKYIAVSLNSLLIWASVVLPAIFPFLIFTSFLTKLGVVDFFSRLISPITKFLFNTDGTGAYVYTISIISGYPVGAKVTADLYESGRIDKGNALRVMTYSANSDPMFILGTVGIGMLASPTAGYIILISRFLGAIINGVFYRNYQKNNKAKNELKDSTLSTDNFLFSTAISSANSMLVVGFYIVMFFVLIHFLSGLIPDSFPVFKAIFNGVLEITHGAKDISLLNITLKAKTLIACFIITFSGVSTAVQSLAFLKKMKFSTSFFILLKLTHACFSTIICFLIFLVFPNLV